jgi:hypothetical protein
MTFDLHQILASKRAYRHTLATRDIAEKLRMLDSLRERALALRSARSPGSIILREEPPSYRTDK